MQTQHGHFSIHGKKKDNRYVSRCCWKLETVLFLIMLCAFLIANEFEALMDYESGTIHSSATPVSLEINETHIDKIQSSQADAQAESAAPISDSQMMQTQLSNLEEHQNIETDREIYKRLETDVLNDILPKVMMNKIIDCFKSGLYKEVKAGATILLQDNKEYFQKNNPSELYKMILCKAVSELALQEKKSSYKETIGFGTEIQEVTTATLEESNREEADKKQRTFFSLEDDLKSLEKLADADGLFEYAVDCYKKQRYLIAEIIYKEMLELDLSDFSGNACSYSRSDILNNLTLIQLQLQKNKEALKNMRLIFIEKNADVHYVINLLVAAYVNGISARDILQSTHADKVIENWSAKMNRDKPGDTMVTQTAIAYNLAWMDMELPESHVSQAVYIKSLIYPPKHERYHTPVAYARKRDLLKEIIDLLKTLNADGKQFFNESDKDLDALRTYTEALRGGGMQIKIENGK